jgi:hypothetical protein
MLSKIADNFRAILSNRSYLYEVLLVGLLFAIITILIVWV